MIFDKDSKTITLNNETIQLIHTRDNEIHVKSKKFLKALGYDDRRNYHSILETNLRKYEKETIKFIIDFKSLKDKYKDEITFLDQPHALYINEKGIYEFLCNSNKKGAQEFRRWVFDVLETIRKDGVYIRDQENNKKIEELQKEVKILLKKTELQDITIKDQDNKIISLSNDKNKISSDYESIRDKFETINTKIITPVEDEKMPTITICDLKATVMNKFKYYVIRCQKRSLETRLKKITLKFPLLEILKTFDDPNSFTTYNYVKQYEDADFRYNYISLKNNSIINTFIQYIETVRHQIESLPI